MVLSMEVQGKKCETVHNKKLIHTRAGGYRIGFLQI